MYLGGKKIFSRSLNSSATALGFSLSKSREESVGTLGVKSSVPAYKYRNKKST